jgi:hypothetical protein
MMTIILSAVIRCSRNNAAGSGTNTGSIPEFGLSFTFYLEYLPQLWKQSRRILWKTAGSMLTVESGISDLPAYVFGERIQSR